LVAGKADVLRIAAKGFSPDEEVSEVDPGSEGLRTEIPIFEADGGFGRNPKAVVDVGLERKLRVAAR
jgi:hypothetical protein